MKFVISNKHLGEKYFTDGIKWHRSKVTVGLFTTLRLWFFHYRGNKSIKIKRLK